MQSLFIVRMVYYSITTKMLFVRRAELLVRKYLTEGPDYLDQEIINDYVKEIDDRYFHGTIEKKHYDRTKREIA